MKKNNPAMVRAVMSGVGMGGLGAWAHEGGGGMCNSARREQLRGQGHTSFRSICATERDFSRMRNCGCEPSLSTCLLDSEWTWGRGWCCPSTCPTGSSNTAADAAAAAAGDKISSADVVAAASPAGAAAVGVWEGIFGAQPQQQHTDRSEASITALQQRIIASGCTLPRFGVDGEWGSETRNGVRCLGQRMGGLEAVYAQFPFVRSLMSSRSSASGGGSPDDRDPGPPSGSGSSLLTSPWLWGSVAGVLAIGAGVFFLYRRLGQDDSPTDEEVKLAFAMLEAERARSRIT